MEIDGAESAIAALDGILQRASNPRGLFDNIGASLVASTQYRFETGKGPDGSPWPVSIRAAFEGGKTLLDSTRSLSSITHNATETFVEVGTNVIYAAIHQLCGVIRPVTAKFLFFKAGGSFVTKSEVTIPARPFLGLDEDDKEEIVLIGEDWLKGDLDAD